MFILKAPGKDIFESSAQTLINPVNVVGVMGKGLALEFKERYPELFKAYRKACFGKVFSTKGIFVWTASKDRKVLCLPTKKEWWFPSKKEWIDKALEIVARDYKLYGITSLAVPAIGCGNGGLDWSVILPIIEKHLAHLDITVEVYPP